MIKQNKSNLERAVFSEVIREKKKAKKSMLT